MYVHIPSITDVLWLQTETPRMLYFIYFEGYLTVKWFHFIKSNELVFELWQGRAVLPCHL